MKYSEILKYILEIPMFQNVGQAAYNPTLDGITSICEFLGNPYSTYKTIHVAGTNGKGSSSNLLCEILQQSGLKVGLYTSPHMIDYRERITINSQIISEKTVEDFMSVAFEKIDTLQLSFFEFTTALAFWAFAREGVDIAIIETGLGGTFDSTNIITPIASLITNIGIDHKAILGDTIEKIASQKAGIIKRNITTVVSEATNQTRPIFEEKSRSIGGGVIFAQDVYDINNNRIENNVQKVEFENKTTGYTKQFDMAMIGTYQSKNLRGVLCLIDYLNNSKLLEVSSSAIAGGVAKCVVMGRWQVISQSPYVVCDVGHNFDGISQVVEMINLSTYENLYIVIGFMADKDIQSIIELLPKNAKYIATQPQNERSMNCEELAKYLRNYDLDAKAVAKVGDAVSFAINSAGERDMVFIGGSTFVVADYLSNS